MGKLVVTITNFFKNCGGSLPSLLIIALWIFSTYLLYPHQAPKSQEHVSITNKQKNIKISIAKVPSQKNKTITHSIAESIQTPTPTIMQITSEPQEPTNTNKNSIPTISPTRAPAAGLVLQNNTNQKPPAPIQEIANTNTVPTANQPKPTVDNQNQNNNGTLAGVSKTVNQIIPAAVSLLGSKGL
jgi:hypothetical protein